MPIQSLVVIACFAYLMAAFAARFSSRYDTTGSGSLLETYKETILDLTKSVAMFLLPAALVIVIYQSIAAADHIPEAPIALGFFATGARLHLLAQRDGGHWHLKTIRAVMAVFLGFSALRFLG